MHAFYPGSVLARGIRNFWRQWSRIKPVLTGADLKARGYAPGPGFGKILAALRQARLEGEAVSRAGEEKFLRKNFPLGTRK